MLGLGNSISTSGISEVLLTDISNLSLYLQNGVGVTVGGWNDSSGNDNHATQGVEADQATVTEGGLLFESVAGDHYDLRSQIAIGDEEGFTVFATVTLTNSGANQTLLGLNNIEHFLEFVGGSNSLKIKLGGATTTISPGDGSQGDFGAGEKFLLTLVREAGTEGNLNVYKNGTLLAQDSQVSNTGDAEFISVGVRNDNRFLNALLHDIVLYEKELSHYELSNAHAHLTGYHEL